MARKFYDFGDPANGRVVDQHSFTAIRPAQYATGTVIALYPNDPRVLGIALGNGDTRTIRVSA